MELKSITRFNGKIRVVSTEFGQEHVDEFHDYGLPEVDDLILAFMKGDIAHHDSIRGMYYVFGNYSYAVNSHVYIHSRDYKDSYILISKHVTSICYSTFFYIMRDSIKYTSNNLGLYNEFSTLRYKDFSKFLDGRHITRQSIKEFSIVNGSTMTRGEFIKTIQYGDTLTKLH